MKINQTLILVVALATLPNVPSPAAVPDDATLRVVEDKAASQLIFEIGPVSMPTGGHHAIRQPDVQAVAIPVDGYLGGLVVELTDDQGRVLPSVLLHHINIIAPNRRELFSQIMQRVGAAGAETGPLKLPRFLGYPVSRGDSLIFSVMLHNPTDESYENVRVQVRMKYTPYTPLSPRLAIQPFYVDVMPPAGVHAFSLPPGKSTKSWEGSPAIPGRVLGVGGHMHKYGVQLRFEDVTAGKVLWEARPSTDDAGNVIAMPRKFFLSRLGLQLDPAHTYRLTAEYYNPTGETITDGAMGTLGGIFVPDERAQWPEVDRTNPEYLADVEVTYARNSNAAQPHHHH